MVTREQFAKWSLEWDVAQGNMPRGSTLETLSAEEREIYLGEADAYLAMDREDWPLDILERLNKEN